MTFAEIISQRASSADSQQNIITDGADTCTYAEIPGLLEQLGLLLRDKGVRTEHCLAVECANSLAGALTLLFLLQQGYRFVLLPPAGKQDLKPIPAFCQFHLVIQPPVAKRPESASWSQKLAGSLRVEPISGYDPAQDKTESTPGKLYLRTSGSMGVSKIVVHAHATLLQNAQNCLHHYRFNSSDRVSIPVPVFHLYGFGAAFLPAILAGSAIDLQHNANLIKYLHREKHFRPTITVLTPSLCEMLLHGFQNPRSYKLVLTSGQRIKEDLFRRFDQRVGGSLVNQYGSSEMGAIAACTPDDPIEQRVAMLGKPMDGVSLTVEEVQPDASNGAGHGILFCCHPYGFQGYVDETGAWLYRAQPENWYPTGDMVALHPNAGLEVIGRADNSINRSGYLVLLTDIEKALEKLSTVKQVVVVAMEEQNMQGQQLAAFCILQDDDAQFTPEQIRESCFDILPHYARPERIVVVEAFPSLPSGKIDRQALRSQVTG